MHRDTPAPATVVHVSVAGARGVFKHLYISLTLILAVCPELVLSVLPASMRGTSLAHRQTTYTPHAASAPDMQLTPLSQVSSARRMSGDNSKARCHPCLVKAAQSLHSAAASHPLSKEDHTGEDAVGRRWSMEAWAGKCAVGAGRS